MPAAALAGSTHRRSSNTCGVDLPIHFTHELSNVLIFSSTPLILCGSFPSGSVNSEFRKFSSEGLSDAHSRIILRIKSPTVIPKPHLKYPINVFVWYTPSTSTLASLSACVLSRHPAIRLSLKLSAAVRFSSLNFILSFFLTLTVSLCPPLSYKFFVSATCFSIFDR